MIGSVSNNLQTYNVNSTNANSNYDPIIVNTEILKTNDFSLSKQYSSIIRLVQQNSITSINWQEKGITLNNAIESLTRDSTFNSEMKNMVLEHVGKTTNNAVKLAILEKGLVFLETERTLSNLVNVEKLSLEDAKEILTKCLDFGCKPDFNQEKLNEFNTFLENSEGKAISGKLDELFNPLDVANTQQKATAGITQSTPHQIVDAKLAFEKLSEYSWENNNNNAIKGTIKDFINESNVNFDKKLLDNIQETLKENFEIDTKTFNKAWAEAISTTQGGEVIENGSIALKFGQEEVELNLKFTPQFKMSGFVGDTTGMKHCSTVYQSTEEGATQHAVNLWRQDIILPDKKSLPMSFLRHGYILNQETAAKEILANACCLQHGEEAILNTTHDNPLSLNFSNIQLMSFGKIADKDKPWKQMEMFNSLAKNEAQPLELTYGDKKVFVKIEQPLLFNFGTNLQHFSHLEIGSLDAKKQVEKQNLESFKQLFGEKFPKLTKSNGNVNFENNSLISKALADPNIDEAKKKQVKTLAKQILDIYQSHPEGLKDNPYALPTRVLALTNLLGYASSFNCKSGKDRTGLCSMELSNLCAQIMAGKEINDPMQSIGDEEQKNLQAIYKEGSSVKTMSKINTIFQDNLKIEEDMLGISVFDSNQKRFGVSLKESFEKNLEILNPQNQGNE